MHGSLHRSCVTVVYPNLELICDFRRSKLPVPSRPATRSFCHYPTRSRPEVKNHYPSVSAPEYQVKQEEGHPRTDTALVNVDVLDTVLLSLHPKSKVPSEVSERTKEGLKELHCFAALINLEKVTKAEMEQLLESLPDTYASQLGQCNSCKHPS